MLYFYILYINAFCINIYFIFAFFNWKIERGQKIMGEHDWKCESDLNEFSTKAPKLNASTQNVFKLKKLFRYLPCQM